MSIILFPPRAKHVRLRHIGEASACPSDETALALYATSSSVPSAARRKANSSLSVLDDYLTDDMTTKKFHSPPKRFRHFTLHADGGFELICWMEDNPRLTAGRRFTLIGRPNEWWVVHRGATFIKHPPEKPERVSQFS